MRPETSLRDGAKCALISMDSTIRSTLSVGPPLDLTICRRDALRAELRLNITGDDEYFRMVRSKRSEALRQPFRGLPDPPWG